MSKTLVVVESPAKAKTIKKYLGAGYEVMASKGHIKDLPKKMGIDVEDGFKETYEIIETKAKVLAELLGDVPGDGFTLAVGVGCEQEHIGLLRFGLELLQHLGLRLDDLVRLLEAILHVDAHLLGQIFDVALAGQHLVPGAQVLLDRLGFGGGLDDDEGLTHLLYSAFPSPLNATSEGLAQPRSLGDRYNWPIVSSSYVLVAGPST